jgi:hypothetical protein
MPPIPSSERERNLMAVLSLLKSGEPLRRLDRFNLRRQLAIKARELIRNAVAETRVKGPVSDRLVIWLIATWGGGKTETLWQILEALDDKEVKAGEAKVALAYVNLKEGNTVRTAVGLESAIFNSCFLSGKSEVRQQIDRYVSTLKVKTVTSAQSAESLAGLGLDIVTSLFNVTVPGVGPVLGRGIRTSWTKFRLRESRLRELVQQRGITDDLATELLVRWWKYAVAPSQKKWEEFKTFYEGLADTQALFKTLCLLLKASGFATLVLAVDEAFLLLNNTRLTEAFEGLRSHQVDGSADLNLYFLFAGTPMSEELKDEAKYGGFPRRFTIPGQAPVHYFYLKPPSVEEAGGAADDLHWALEFIRNISPDLPKGTLVPLTDQLEKELRKELSAESAKTIADGKTLRWNRFWSVICSKVLVNESA